MLFLFCKSPTSSDFDDMYQDEVDAAKAAEFPMGKINFEALIDGDFSRAIAGVPENQNYEPQTAVYRGWMMTSDTYSLFHEALFMEKNIWLITTPTQYRFAHYLPYNYKVLEDLTPKSLWLPADATIEEIMAALEVFGSKPVIVKDFVKSQKHFWHSACFIPDASLQSEVQRVVNNFIDFQGEFLEGGLVFREYIDDLVSVGNHERSGMPITKENRIFVLNNEVMVSGKYWTAMSDDPEPLPVGFINNVISRIDARFWTLDIAQKTNGGWIVMEIGDAQVSGLLDTINTDKFYEKLKEIV